MKRIVVIDDDPYIQDVFHLIFEEDYELVAYTDGSSVLKYGGKPPDLFIVVKQLSDMDGLDLCRMLKAQDKTRNIPVIIICATEGLRTTAKIAGAEEVLEKPFRIQAVQECVKRHLSGE